MHFLFFYFPRSWVHRLHSWSRDWTQKKILFSRSSYLRSSNFDTQLPSLRKNLFYFSRLVESKNLSAKKLSTKVRKFPERKIKNFFKNAVRKLCRLFLEISEIILIFVGEVLQICNKGEGIEGITAP